MPEDNTHTVVADGKGDMTMPLSLEDAEDDLTNDLRADGLSPSSVNGSGNEENASAVPTHQYQNHRNSERRLDDESPWHSPNGSARSAGSDTNIGSNGDEGSSNGSGNAGSLTSGYNAESPVVSPRFSSHSADIVAARPRPSGHRRGSAVVSSVPMTSELGKVKSFRQQQELWEKLQADDDDENDDGHEKQEKGLHRGHHLASSLPDGRFSYERGNQSLRRITSAERREVRMERLSSAMSTAHADAEQKRDPVSAFVSELRVDTRRELQGQDKNQRQIPDDSLDESSSQPNSAVSITVQGRRSRSSSLLFGGSSSNSLNELDDKDENTSPVSPGCESLSSPTSLQDLAEVQTSQDLRRSQSQELPMGAEVVPRSSLHRIASLRFNRKSGRKLTSIGSDHRRDSAGRSRGGSNANARLDALGLTGRQPGRRNFIRRAVTLVMPLTSSFRKRRSANRVAADAGCGGQSIDTTLSSRRPSTTAAAAATATSNNGSRKKKKSIFSAAAQNRRQSRKASTTATKFESDVKKRLNAARRNSDYRKQSVFAGQPLFKTSATINTENAFIIYPDGSFNLWRQSLLIFLSMLSAVMIPLVIVTDTSSMHSVVCINTVVDFVFLINIPIEFFVALKVDRFSVDLITDLAEIRRRLLRGPMWLELIYSIPMDLIAIACGFSSSFLNALRTLRLLRLRNVSALPSSTNLGMLIRQVIILYIVGHYAGCMWWGCAWIEDFPRNEVYRIYNKVTPSACNLVPTTGPYTSHPASPSSPLSSALVGVEEMDVPVYVGDLFGRSRNGVGFFMENYLHILVWGMRTVSSFASEVYPETALESVMVLMIVFTGLLMYAYVLGAIFEVISSLSSKSKEYRDYVEETSMWFKTRHFDPKLANRVLQYRRLQQEFYNGVNEVQLLDNLPETLRRDITCKMRSPMLTTNPSLRLLSSGFIGSLANALVPEIFVALEIIITAGEEGSKMFFVDVGQVDVIQQGSNRLIATLDKGDFFGEISVIMNCPRTAHVQSSVVTELFGLHDLELAKLMELYPSFKRMLINVAEERAKELNEQKHIRKSFSAPSNSFLV